MESVYLALGSNEGDRVLQLKTAINSIAAHCGPLLQLSPVYETAPWGVADQPDYLNMVIVVETSILPHQLLSALQEIEAGMHRVREERWGQRTIDIDILLYGNEVINTTDLVVPHPRIQDRLFVLVPMAAIAPDLIHPTLLKTVAELLSECKDELEVRLFSNKL